MKPFIASEFISNQETPVATSCGERVEIITTTARGEYSIIGYIGQSTQLQRWTSAGFFYAESPLVVDRNLHFTPKIEVVHAYKAVDGLVFATGHLPTAESWKRAGYTYLGTITGPIVPPEEGK